MNDRIIDKIKKLIRHERSAREVSTPEEAAAFAAKIQQLCIDNKIEAEQVNVDNEPERGAAIGDEGYSTGREKKQYWSRVSGEDNRLMYVVAKAHFCSAFANTGTNIITLVGEEQDRAVCKAMFEYLREAMRRGASVARQAQLKQRRTVRQFRRDFCYGFTAAISERYEQMRAAADNTTMALVRADALVKAYVDSKFKVKTRENALDGRKNWAAMNAGMKHGEEVSLATNVTGPSSVVTGQLAE